MIDFWMATGLLLVVALSFLLIPLLRGHRAQREEDRTALNVALYQERLSELQVQQEQGVLSLAQLQAARAEAARELLADTEGAEPAGHRVWASPGWCWPRCWCRYWGWQAISSWVPVTGLS